MILPSVFFRVSEGFGTRITRTRRANTEFCRVFPVLSVFSVLSLQRVSGSNTTTVYWKLAGQPLIRAFSTRTVYQVSTSVR